MKTTIEISQTNSGSVSPKFVGATLCGCPFGGQTRSPLHRCGVEIKLYHNPKLRSDQRLHRIKPGYLAADGADALFGLFK